MAGSNHNHDVDPKVLKELEQFWGYFMTGTKYCSIAVIIVLVLMAVTLL